MIKFLVMDVDGTLTDGKIYMGSDGEIFKAFSIKDGCGIKDILPKHGILPIIITARESKLLKIRCQELGITYLYQGERNKLARMESVIEEYNKKNNSSFSFAECAYIGDDILDLQCMNLINAMGGKVGCPADAVPEVKAIAHYITNNSCGNGAVREFIEYLIRNNTSREQKNESAVKRAISFVNSLDTDSIPIGKYFVDDDIYYMVQEYTTKVITEYKLESHKKCIDIQWIIKGCEKIAVADVSYLELEEEYSIVKDVMFWREPKNMMEVVLSDNSYVVLYPNNAHKPSIAVENPTRVRKIVVKVRI